MLLVLSSCVSISWEDPKIFVKMSTKRNKWFGKKWLSNSFMVGIQPLNLCGGNSTSKYKCKNDSAIVFKLFHVS